MFTVDGKDTVVLPMVPLWTILGSQGSSPPRCFFTCERHATAVARSMAHRHEGEFYVLGLESCHQRQLKVASFYIRPKEWLADAIATTQRFWAAKRKTA